MIVVPVGRLRPRGTMRQHGIGSAGGFGLLAIVLVILDVTILATFSAYHFDTNDNMYAAAPFAPGALYRDVHFIQGPVTFYFLNALTFVTTEGFSYLGLRLASMGLLLATLFVGAFMCIDRWPSRCMFLAFAGTNIYFIFAGFEIGSYALPLFLLALASACIWKIQNRQIAIASSALLIGLAASAKLNHVLFFLPLAVFVLLQRRKEEGFSDWARAALLPFAAGGFAGSLPVIVAFVQEPDAFLLHTLTFHSRFSLRTWNVAPLALFEFGLNFLVNWALVGGGAVLVALGFCATAVSRKSDERSRHFLLFVMLATLTALVAAISPGVTYVQYWAPATFFAALGGARFFDLPRARLGLIGVLAALPIFTVGATVLQSRLSASLRETSGTPRIATVIEVHEKLKSYALRMKDARQCDRRIFSLAGAFVADSGFPLSRYMEGAIFWSWVRAQVPQTYITDKSYHLDEYVLFPERWVRDQRINFLLVGYYPGPAEVDIERYAIEHGFGMEVLRVWEGLTLKFYFNPDCID
jgi:hypothetical protein